MKEPLLSICIPSFNRPIELENLIRSIDCNPNRIEIVITEDCSPKRIQVRSCVETLKAYSAYEIRYFENEKNVGYDGNLRRLVELARGTYVMFMGDDDLFIPLALDRFIEFLDANRDKKYVLRSYIVIHERGEIEKFAYLPKSKALLAGEKTVAWLFKRSVTICGFTIARRESHEAATDALDGTLLYQVYLMTQVCLHYDSVYCDIAIVQAVQTFRKDNAMFGSSDAEKNRYTPGSVSINNSVSFTKAYFEVTDYIDKKCNTQLTRLVRRDLSKYSYPFLSIQRKRGIMEFMKYARRLEKEVGFNCTVYFSLYKWGLLLLGERLCNRIIIFIKKSIGYTPNF